ncbi:MAG: hypothetical protein BMS9Abin11_1135 [Gammaproteobacteria bacterium]|nr:MAG: hypothetical protein BMS9Abin11_1135 [Gammaproteobacteria bacterium]
MIDVTEKSGTNGATIRMLHILSDGAPSLAEQVIKLQSQDYQVDVVDISSESIDYGELIDKIFTYDKVISW